MNQNMQMVARRSPNAMARSRNGSRRDTSVQDCFAVISKVKNDMKKLDSRLRKELVIEPNRRRHFFGRALFAIVPKKIMPYLPERAQRFAGEQYDVLMEIARLMRTNIITFQDALRMVSEHAITNTEECVVLETDLVRAQEEKWDAQQLQDYLAEQAGIPIYEEIRTLLDIEFTGLTPEQKETRKDETLQILRNTVTLKQELTRTYGSACNSLLSTFGVFLTQDYAYNQIYPHIAVLRDASQSAVDMNHSMFVGKQALETTVEMAFEAIEIALEATDVIRKNSIASADLQQLLRSGKEGLERKMQLIEGKKRKMLDMAAPDARDTEIN